MKKALIIFLKYPELGRAKTRLAKSIGNEKTLKVYIELLNYTKLITNKLGLDIFLYYDKVTAKHLDWERENTYNAVQFEGDLGERMEHAFDDVFKMGYQEVVIIGSDCYELTEQIINEAFALLNLYDVVFGPAKDGGYYLLGLRKLVKPLFQNMQWSTENVLKDALQVVEKEHLKAGLLPVLSDIDTIEDLPSKLKYLIM